MWMHISASLGVDEFKRSVVDPLVTSMQEQFSIALLIDVPRTHAPKILAALPTRDFMYSEGVSSLEGHLSVLLTSCFTFSIYHANMGENSEMFKIRDPLAHEHAIRIFRAHDHKDASFCFHNKAALRPCAFFVVTHRDQEDTPLRLPSTGNNVVHRVGDSCSRTPLPSAPAPSEGLYAPYDARTDQRHVEEKALFEKYAAFHRLDKYPGDPHRKARHAVVFGLKPHWAAEEKVDRPSHPPSVFYYRMGRVIGGSTLVTDVEPTAANPSQATAVRFNLWRSAT